MVESAQATTTSSAQASPEKWIHLSDLHFGTETPAVVGALRGLVDTENPRGLVISGDVTQRAKPDEFRAAAHFLETLTNDKRLIIVPGNHDIPLFRIFERAIAPYHWFERAFGDVEHVRVVDEGHFRFVLVNTTRWFRHKQGTLDEEQIDQVGRAIEDAPRGSVRAVVLHHPLPAFNDSGERFVGGYTAQHVAENAVRVWAEAGLDLAFCGHTHHPRVLRLTESEAPILPPPTSLDAAQSVDAAPQDPGSYGLAAQRALGWRRTPWLIQAGTSLSRRLRNEPNSLYILVSTPTTDEEKASFDGAPAQLSPHLHLERWDFSVSTQKFERMSQVILN